MARVMSIRPAAVTDVLPQHLRMDLLHASAMLNVCCCVTKEECMVTARRRCCFLHDDYQREKRAKNYLPRHALEARVHHNP